MILKLRNGKILIEENTIPSDVYNTEVLYDYELGTNHYTTVLTIDGTTYTISCDKGNGLGLEATNSTFNGWTSYAATIGAVKFVGCSFGEGQGYAFCRPYNASVFENCVFEEGFEFDTSQTSDITFINCYYGETLITAENAASIALFGGALNGITIK